jgi:hypothetical protein
VLNQIGAVARLLKFVLLLPIFAEGGSLSVMFNAGVQHRLSIEKTFHVMIRMHARAQVYANQVHVQDSLERTAIKTLLYALVPVQLLL